MAKPADAVRTGRCDCGAVRLQITGEMRPVLACHCGQCRRTHGNFATYTNAPRKKIEIVGAEELTWYQSSNFARRGFCRRCGSSMLWERLEGASISIAAGCLDVPTNLRTSEHVFFDDRSDYYEIDDGLKKWPGASQAMRSDDGA